MSHPNHIVPWSKGGKTVPENLQMLCSFDNNSKGNK
ncbi:HNH endonuclease [Microbacterium aurum]